MQILLQDLRYSLRQLIRSPGFTLTAVISLALGIGATSAVFSVIYAALLNPFPYPSAGRIVRPILASKSSPEYMPVLTGPQIRQVRQNAAVEDVLAMDYQSLTLSSKGLQQSIRAISLISTGFQDLGVPPALGRGILPSDSVDGQDPEPVVDRQPAKGEHVAEDVASVQWRQRKQIKCGQKQIQQHPDIKN